MKTNMNEIKRTVNAMSIMDLEVPVADYYLKRVPATGTVENYTVVEILIKDRKDKPQYISVIVNKDGITYELPFYVASFDDKGMQYINKKCMQQLGQLCDQVGVEHLTADGTTDSIRVIMDNCDKAVGKIVKVFSYLKYDEESECVGQFANYAFSEDDIAYYRDHMDGNVYRRNIE